MTSWAADTLLPGHATCTIELPDEPTYALEPPGSLVATLTRYGEPRCSRAVLYLHGWSDYFFQPHLGPAFRDMGYDFYGLDLRRYGRSLREGQLAGYIPDMTHYRVELDRAVAILRAAGHDEIVLAGHSTGGLVAALYADDRPGTFAAVVLNAPWIELRGSPVLRPSMHPLMRTMTLVAPTTAIPMSDPGTYRRSVSIHEDGEWDYDDNLKGNKAFLVRIGWLEAVLAGQQRIARGLDIAAPVLVVTSARSAKVTSMAAWSDECLSTDTVLDVRRIAERSPDLGRHVTLVRLEGALHDVVLSARPVRERAFDEVRRFLHAYAR